MNRLSFETAAQVGQRPEVRRLGIFDFSVSLSWQFLIDKTAKLAVGR
jgi:hypothetical protein